MYGYYGKGKDKRPMDRVLSALFFFSLAAFILCIPEVSLGSEISARSAVVMDMDTNKVLFAKNPNQRQAPASTTKLVTAMVALDYLHPNHVVTVSENAAATAFTSGMLRPGDTMTVKDLLYLLLMRSVNGAGVALAEEVAGSEEEFARMMNKKAARLGAVNTRYVNSNGLPGDGQYITAYDLAKIMKSSLRYPLIRRIINTKTKTVTTFSGRDIRIRNTNKLLWEDDALLGGKTGFTSAAKHCLAFAAEKSQGTLVAAVLGAGNRASLWQNAEVLLAKGQDIGSGNAQPVIYNSASEETQQEVRPARSGRASYRAHHRYHKKSSHVRSSHKRAAIEKSHGTHARVASHSSSSKSVKKAHAANRTSVKMSNKAESHKAVALTTKSKLRSNESGSKAMKKSGKKTYQGG